MQCFSEKPRKGGEEMKIKTYKSQIYKDQQDTYRWRIIATNGCIVAAAGVGYKTKRNCAKSLNNLLDVFYNIALHDKDSFIEYSN